MLSDPHYSIEQRHGQQITKSLLSRYYDNNINNITYKIMALKSSEARTQKRNKTKAVIIFKSRDIQGSSSVLRGRRLFKVEKQF